MIRYTNIRIGNTPTTIQRYIYGIFHHIIHNRIWYILTYKTYYTSYAPTIIQQYHIYIYNGCGSRVQPSRVSQLNRLATGWIPAGSQPGETSKRRPNHGIELVTWTWHHLVPTIEPPFITYKATPKPAELCQNVWWWRLINLLYRWFIDTQEVYRTVIVGYHSFLSLLTPIANHCEPPVTLDRFCLRHCFTTINHHQPLISWYCPLIKHYTRK